MCRSLRGRAPHGDGSVRRTPGGVHVQAPGDLEGEGLPRVDLDRLRGPTGHEELLEDNRLAVRAPLRASLPRRRRRNRGTASGALRPVPQSLADESFPRLRQGPPVSASSKSTAPNARVIMTLADAPLAQIAPRSAFSRSGRAVSSTSRARSRARTSPGSSTAQNAAIAKLHSEFRRRRCLGATACC